MIVRSQTELRALKWLFVRFSMLEIARNSFKLELVEETLVTWNQI